MLCAGCCAAGYEDMDEAKLAILEPPYARSDADRFTRFLSKM